MLSKKKHVADNFLLKFQDEDKRFINIYHFGIEPMGFQTPLTLELLSKTIINPDCCEGKYPHVNVVNESVNKLFETCGSKEKQKHLQIVTTYSNHYACAYTKFSRDSLTLSIHSMSDRHGASPYRCTIPVGPTWYILDVMYVVCIVMRV